MAEPTQIFEIALSPSQRWALVQLAFDKASPPIKDAAAGKRFRRALRAIGLMPIRDALKEHNALSTVLAGSSTLARFKVTIDNLECVLSWATIGHHASTELDAGEVFDLCERVIASPADCPVSEVPYYDPASEDWTPPPAPAKTETCPKCGEVFELDADEEPAAA